MRRIFTLSFALVCLLATQNLFAQNCAATAPNPAVCSGSVANDFNTNNGSFTATSSATGTTFAWSGAGASGKFQADVPQNTTLAITSPAYYLTSSNGTVTAGFNLGGTIASTNGSNISYIKLDILNASTQQVLATCQITNTSLGGNSTSITQGTQCITVVNTSTLTVGTMIQYRFTIVTGSYASTKTVFFDDFSYGGNSNAPLPVHFSKVAVQKAAEAALINWSVGTEQNVYGYDVEKSTDGRSFTKIGFVVAQGLSSYSFADTKAGAVNFYRIKSIDLDGKYSLSTVVLLNNGAASVVVKAFMSDKNTLTVQHDAAQAGSRISVVSMDGRVVKLQQPNAGAQQTTVDLSAAQTGLYIVRYDNGQGGTQSIKVAK